MRSRTGLVAIAALFCLWGLPALAQQSPRVAGGGVCGNPPPGFTYTPGQPAPATVDGNGNTCGNATGGGGGAVTIANGADVALGNTGDASWSGTGASTVVAALKNIALGVASSVPAGTNLIGHVIVDASSAVIGHVIVDSGTITTVSAVTAITNALPAGTNTIGNVGLTSQYPNGAVPITASATGTTAATTATLAASASIKTYICGFSIRANATAAATANSTVTGTVTGTLNFTQWTAPLASGIGLTEMVFMPCVPSSAINTGIAVISAAPGSGGVVSVSAWGYQL